jgi:hypothetical protein
MIAIMWSRKWKNYLARGFSSARKLTSARDSKVHPQATNRDNDPRDDGIPKPSDSAIVRIPPTLHDHEQHAAKRPIDETHEYQAR